jgi:hypothetical protein
VFAKDFEMPSKEDYKWAIQKAIDLHVELRAVEQKVGFKIGSLKLKVPFLAGGYVEDINKDNLFVALHDKPCEGCNDIYDICKQIGLVAVSPLSRLDVKLAKNQKWPSRNEATIDFKVYDYREDPKSNITRHFFLTTLELYHLMLQVLYDGVIASLDSLPEEWKNLPK